MVYASRILRMAACLAAGLIVAVDQANADAVTIPIKNNSSSKTITDMTFLLKANGKITNVPDIDSFTAPKASELGKSTLTLAGGSIAPGASTSIVLATDKVAPRYVVTELSFSDGTKRGTSTQDDIFSLAVPGGASGIDFAGVHIGAGEYGYFYQFDRNALFAASPSRFDVITGASAPTSFGVLSNTWKVADLAGDLGGELGDGDLLALDNHMRADTLTGSPGIGPVSWAFAADRMTASYAAPFAVGDVASVLWFTSALPPEVGGPLGNAGQNAVLYSGASVLFTNGVIGPVDEPPIALMLALGVVVAGLRGLRRRASLRA